MFFIGLIFCLLFCVFLLLLVAFLVLVERNLLSLDQIRKGPNITSWFGVLQTISDSVKLLIKKYFFNYSARMMFFILSPVLGFILPIFSWYFLVVGYGASFSEASVLVVLFVGSLLVYSVVWAGWGSNNTYGMIGAIRAVAQMISYEVIMGLYIIMFIFKFGSFSWSSFSSVNQSYSSNLVFLILFFVWFVVISAEMNRTPFDLVEGESELVGSYNVEFSSGGFTLLFLSEYMSIWLMSSLSLIIFLSFMGFSKLMFFLLSLIFAGVLVHLRAQLPRFKFVDLIGLTWVVLLPLVTVLCVLFLFF